MDISRVCAGYRGEAAGLAAISRKPHYKEIIRNLRDYERYAGKQLARLDSRPLLGALTDKYGVINVMKTPDAALYRILGYAHIAACCVLFEGASLKSGVLDGVYMEQVLEAMLEPGVPNLLRPRSADLSDRLHRSDAMRMMTILRQMGLCLPASAAIRQVSFAAGGGNKDIRTIHSLPKAEVANGCLRLSLEYRQARHIVLIDNDESVATSYERLNTECGGKVLALVDDALQGVYGISRRVAAGELQERTLVMGIRVDHRMISSVPRFFSELAPILAERAELVISIGAGHTLEEFAGRIALMHDIRVWLRERQLSPVHIKLHGAGSIQQQRSSPAFGASGYTTYEIIHCVLEKQKLVDSRM